MIALQWMLTFFIKVTLYFYAFILGLSQLLKLKEYRVLSLPTGLILVALAPLIAPNYTYYGEIFDNYWVYYVITFGLFLPGFVKRSNVQKSTEQRLNISKLDGLGGCEYWV